VRVLTTNANGRDQVLSLPADVETPIQDHLTVRYCSRHWGESVSPGLLRNLHAYIRWADLVHLEAVYSFPTIPTLGIAGLLARPVVWSPRGALARWKGARHPWLKNVFDRLCRISGQGRFLFHCTSAQELAGSLARFPGAKGVVIPNGVDIPKLDGETSTSPVLRLLYLGRLDPIKGVDNLLAACALLKSRPVRPWQLMVAGGGEAAYRAQLQSQIQRQGLERHVQMIGPVEGLQKELAFASADVVIVPSHLENFCIVAAEAMAHAIPVVVSRGAPWPGVEDKGCGLWVANDPESLASGIERMARMPLEEMGKKGRAWMEADFAWSRIAGQIRALYQSLLRDHA
jgi:glycosyltransferase involved in cell wall biosynthesis